MLDLVKRKRWQPRAKPGGGSSVSCKLNVPRMLRTLQRRNKRAFEMRWSDGSMGYKINSDSKRNASARQPNHQVRGGGGGLPLDKGTGPVATGDSFHRAVAPILLLAQFFGVMPVNGITNRNLTTQQFRWTSLRTIYSIFCCGSLASYAVITLSYNITKKMTIESFVSCVFYGSNTTVIISFLFMARKWPTLIAKWTQIEAELMPKSQLKTGGAHPPGKYRMWHDWRLSTKIRLITASILCLCAIEHSLSIKRYIYYAENCPKVKDRTKAIFVQHFTELFYFTSYTLPKAVWARFMITISVFTWSYMDCFVSVVSVGISTGFYKINSQMRVVKGMNVPEEFWKRQRRNYRNLCELCELVDDHISHLTMTSFTNNLFFICVQLLNSMQARPSFFHTFYFWFSLILLIGRTLAVIMFSSQINDQSRGPMEFIRVVPGQSWCLELRRFYEEVATDTIALTGMKFFNLTRGVILSVAGTIITYELVLIQLRSKHQNEVDLCEEIYF